MKWLLDCTVLHCTVIRLYHSQLGHNVPGGRYSVFDQLAELSVSKKKTILYISIAATAVFISLFLVPVQLFVIYLILLIPIHLSMVWGLTITVYLVLRNRPTLPKAYNSCHDVIPAPFLHIKIFQSFQFEISSYDPIFILISNTIGYIIHIFYPFRLRQLSWLLYMKIPIPFLK